MPRPINEAEREATTEQIKVTAQRLMAQHGTSGLSMRAIAREMGISAPALYHYFSSMDDLITALILDAFNGLADACEAGRNAEETTLTQIRGAMHGYRNWALAHPTQFQLIYGNPIPGYEAPVELTVPASARTLLVFGRLIEAAIQTGEINPQVAIPPENEAALQHIITEFTNNEGSVMSAYITNMGWSIMHGIVMLELFGHLAPVVGDVDAFYDAQIDQLIQQMQ